MGTTVHGLPYPEPTDPVAAGAAAIRSLAEAVDAQVDNGAVGVVYRDSTTTDTGGYGPTELVLSQIEPFVVNPRASRLTAVSYGIILAAVTQPAGQSAIIVRLRLGTNTAGSVVESHVYPWAAGQQSFGPYQIALQREFIPAIYPAGAQAVITFQTGTGMGATIGAGTWIAATDHGN